MRRVTTILGLAALFTPGFLTPASADVIDLYNLNVTLNGSPAFTDSFSATQVLAGGTGAVFPAGPGLTYSDGTTQAFYAVMGRSGKPGVHRPCSTPRKGANSSRRPPVSSRW